MKPKKTIMMSITVIWVAPKLTGKTKTILLSKSIIKRNTTSSAIIDLTSSLSGK
jgi:hypothetical protein